ncbi:MAG: Lamin-B receptor of domain [Myxococcaceae bacterium]|nr:Lamin-B receptor of domain [Myxococcaceae bacterium]
MDWKQAGVLALVAATTAFAQPAKPGVAQAIRDAKFAKGVTCIAADPGRSSNQSALYQNTRTKEIVSKKTFYFSQALECRVPGAIPGFPKAHRMFDGSASYSSLGGAWAFDTWFQWDSWLEGMPAPDKKAIALAIEDKAAVIRQYFLDEITHFYSYGLAPNARVLWKEPTVMKTDVEAVVDVKYGGDLLKKRMVFGVTFQRADASAPWKAMGGEPVQETLSQRTPTAEEFKTLLGWREQERRRVAAERLGSLPVVEIPAFANEADARAFVYKQLMTASAPELESSLRRLYDQPNEDEIAAALAEQAAFKQQYCATPTPKSGRAGFINKDDSSWTEVGFSEVGGAFKDGKRLTQLKLWKLDLGLLKGDKLAAQQSYSYDLCGNVLPRSSGGGEWKVGDRVEVRYTNKWVPGEITRFVTGKVMVRETQQKVEDLWPANDVREPKNPVVAEPAPVAAKEPVVKAAPPPVVLPFAIGDRVEGNYSGRGRWFKGSIKGFNSAQDKAQIKYDDGTSEYLKFELIRKL